MRTEFIPSPIFRKETTMDAYASYTQKIISASVKALHARGVTEYAPRFGGLGKKNGVSYPQSTLDSIQAAHTDVIAACKAGSDHDLIVYADENSDRSGADVLHWAQSVLAGNYA